MNAFIERDSIMIFLKESSPPDALDSNAETAPRRRPTNLSCNPEDAPYQLVLQS